MADARKRPGRKADAGEADGLATPAPSTRDSRPADAVAANPDGTSRPNRRLRLRLAAEARGVPLLTILVTVAVVAGAYLLGRVAYRLREIILIIVIAGFFALLLNPLVALFQRKVSHRRGLAVTAVVVIGAVVFFGLFAAFGYPLSNALANLAHQLPRYVADAQHGHGVVGRVVQHFHLQKWVSTNAPKLQDLGANLARPVVSVGKGAGALIAEMLAVLTLVALLLLEGPRIHDGLFKMLSQERAAWCKRVGSEMQQAAVGYVFGDLLTSLIAGVVVGITMAALGLPYPLLWALWVALVDFLPQIGGALAGIPTVLFAATQSLTDAIILAVVFIVYQQLENHVLNPMVMSKTVRTSPLLIFIAVLVGGAIGAWIGGTFGAFFGALLAVPTAASLQILVRELWRLTAADASTEAQSEAE